MDLIYQDADRNDLGVMKNYEMDLAFGKDENDFELSVDLDEHCLKEEYILYMEGTEYGGIVDKIKASNVDDTVTYSGRTWHGILEGKVIEPAGDNDYLLLSGNANAVLRYLLERWNLTDLFSVEETESPVQIIDYRARFVKGYTGIRKMLYKFGGKLQIRYKENKAVLSAVPYIDYSQDDEFDSSQVCFTCEKDYRPLNHLICTGLGDANEPYVIHLFCDEYKGLQPYAKVDVPIKDTDYILTKEHQKLFGKDEVADVYDGNSVQIVKNYAMIEGMPDGWNKDVDTWNDRFPDIYTLDEEGKYKKSEAKKQDIYTLIDASHWQYEYEDCYILTVDDEGKLVYEHPEFTGDAEYSLTRQIPFNWLTAYSSYYTREIVDGRIEYKQVEPEIGENAFPLTTEPQDWDINYGNYSVAYDDGTTTKYNKVSGVTHYYYEQQKNPPSDWNSNYSGYYKKNVRTGEYVKQEPLYIKQSKKPKNWSKQYQNYYQRKSDGLTVTYQQVAALQKETYQLQTEKPSDWKSNFTSYYTKAGNTYQGIPEGKTPAWKKKKYYTKVNEQTAPSYDSVKPVYAAVAPPWGDHPRYTQRSVTGAPEWKKDTYYLCVESEIAPTWKADTYYRNYPYWQADTYYKKENKMAAPGWQEGTYYRQYLDHYAKLVEKGVEQLKKKLDTDKLDISLELENIYDINDVVGARENVTRQTLWMPVTKKIVKITDTTETVEYEVGE